MKKLALLAVWMALPFTCAAQTFRPQNALCLNPSGVWIAVATPVAAGAQPQTYQPINLMGKATDGNWYGLSCDSSGNLISAGTDAVTVNTNTYPAAAGFNSGGIPYFSSTTAEGSSATLTHYGVVYGGGAAGSPVSMAACGANFPVVGSATAPACSTIGWLASATQWGLPYMSAATQMSSTGALTDNALIKGHSGAAPASSSVTDDGIKVGTAEFLKTGNTQLLTADATPITTVSPGTVVFTWSALPVSTNYSLHCAILYNQQTAAVADGIAIQGATNAPTRIDAMGAIYTTNPASTTLTASLGTVVNLTSTTATAVVTATPGATNTVYQATLDGVVQSGASATTLNVLMFTGNVLDSVTPKAGSYCTLMP